MRGATRCSATSFPSRSLESDTGGVNGTTSIVETDGPADTALVNVVLDDVDRQIIVLLQEDGRMSAREVSRRLGNLGDRAVRYRIDRLLRTGVISVIAVVSSKRIGYPVLGDVIIEVPAAEVRDVLAALAEDELVCYLGADLERGTISLQLAARDEYEFRTWLSSLIKRHQGAAVIKSTLVRHVTKGSDQWPPPRGEAAED
jgi:Lrp/AsnC family transcriptional regulator, regulator for asnA, asnC and gidA